MIRKSASKLKANKAKDANSTTTHRAVLISGAKRLSLRTEKREARRSFAGSARTCVERLSRKTFAVTFFTDWLYETQGKHRCIRLRKANANFNKESGDRTASWYIVCGPSWPVRNKRQQRRNHESCLKTFIEKVGSRRLVHPMTLKLSSF